MDSPGQPEQEDDPTDPQMRAAPDTQQDEAKQVVSLSTAQAAAQLGVNSRTIRRYITVGIVVAGQIVRLQARQVRTNSGTEYQIYQTDLEQFRAERDRAATEGQAAGLVSRAEESTALTTSIQIISVELEQRNLALAEAQQTIERLAREAGQHAGENAILERQLAELQKRVEELTQERNHWRQKASKSYRIRLLPFTEE
jgi:chromosome segregation ATPase